jgi:hypothetical protein
VKEGKRKPKKRKPKKSNEKKATKKSNQKKENRKKKILFFGVVFSLFFLSFFCVRVKRASKKQK